MPKVSIIIPTHNPGKYFTPLIESVRNQTFTDLEIIIVDDGSIDGTRDLLTQYSTIDPRIQIFFRDKNDNEHFGQKWSVDLGREHVTSDYFMIIDHDDELELNAVELLYQMALRYPNADVIQGNSGSIQNGQKYGPVSQFWNQDVIITSIVELQLEDLIKHMILTVPALWACLIKTNYYKGFELEDFISNDTSFVWKMKLLSQGYVHIPECIYYHTVHDESLSGRNHMNQISFSIFEAFQSIEKFLKESNADRSLWLLFSVYEAVVLYLHYQNNYLSPERKLALKNKISEEIRHNLDISEFPYTFDKEFHDFYNEIKNYHSEYYIY